MTEPASPLFTKSELAYNRVREKILSGEFAPDSLLPSEAQLMARYGVSRPTVRNAISALRAEGLIDGVRLADSRIELW